MSVSFTFDYDYVPINDLEVVSDPCPKTGRPIVKAINVKDEPLVPSERFWVSLFARYSFNKAFFKYFSHAETFERISEVEKADRMRLCIERRTFKDGNGNDKTVSTLMAASNPSKPVVEYDELTEQLTKYNGQKVQYANGQVYSTHSPRIGANNFDISGDTFSNRFVMATPIDGYGAPNFYLSLHRVDGNADIIGYARAFRQTLQLGKAADDVMPTITRALDGFGNDEGFAALRQRFECAANSWCSVNEAQKFYKLVTKLHNGKNFRAVDPTLKRAKMLNAWVLTPNRDGKVAEFDDEGGIKSPVLTAFHRMTGDVNHLYGLANLDALAVKRQAALPVDCSVSDLINFASELAAHYLNPDAARQVHAFIGALISDEYDMENTKDKFDTFDSFHVTAKLNEKLTGSK